MNTNDFSEVKVGDKLWSIELGECEVVWIDVLFVHVQHKEGCKVFTYWKNGVIDKSVGVQSLFWSKPDIIAPPKPIMLEGSPLKVGDVVYEKGDCSEHIIHSTTESGAVLNGRGHYAIAYLSEYFTRTKPKRKVKKTVECWSNVYHDYGATYGCVSYFSSREKALKHAGKGAIQVKLTGEYEVTE